MPDPVAGFPDTITIEERGGAAVTAVSALCDRRAGSPEQLPEAGFSLPGPPPPLRFHPETTG